MSTKAQTGATTVTTAGTPVALLATGGSVSSVFIQPNKSLVADNVGDIYVGFSAKGGMNKIRIKNDSPGITLSAPGEKTLQLDKIYVDAANNADGVTWAAIA
jgi:hypothetical protein